ncbi:hypothetical protein M983_0260 [Proteus myxofaciens ATCC 19692]|uniref:Uncharacterized protein n=2 Tax=Proteus myxofaciens TaxID=184072 RepID=A0A198GLK7_9GAMM|nr:hypothetical protein M983_0260 [Proteus myxofaciens ATCC 19692]
MEGMKAVRRWLKEGKAFLTQYCTGMIMTVNTQTNDKEKLVQMSSPISTVYGTQVLVEETLNDAYSKANILLKN